MGWFWGASESSDADQSRDPMRDLDPKLRDFLTKESPVKYTSSHAPTASKPAPTRKDADPQPASPTAQDNKPAVPAQSLYQDGRYAHLWKTYQSQSEAEAESKSDQEKITDVLEGYKYRKAEIGRAALENCAVEQWEINECFKNGGFKSRVTLCREENKSLERCYLMQSKFLKALGYLSTFDRPPETDEKIQMHADTLYHRMLDQEKAIEAAKAEGKPIPLFPSILSTQSTSAQSTTESSLDDNKIKASDLPASVQKGLKERLEGLSPEERILEESAIKAEIQAGEQVAERLGVIYQKQDEEKRLRKEQGKETIGDKLSSIFGFR